MQNEITESIIKLMKARAITQNDLAVELKCTQTAVSNLLTGKSKLTIDDLDTISRRLGIAIHELLAEASRYNNMPINIPSNIEEIITDNELSFYIVNRLRIPASVDEIFLELDLDEESKAYVLKLIDILRTNNIIEITSKGEVFASLNHERVLHYRLTKKYWDRIVEIYKNLRPVVADVIKNEKKMLKWKEKNIDAFYLEFFTEDQIKSQHDLLRQFLDLVKHQIRINSSNPDKDTNKNKELRVIYTTLAPYPKKDIRGE